ncbi:hypothetical protein ACERK3_14095 [Phycisphaerales bacterium AB-hyl4]|uniref:DUF3106 domain-containing protein n=1 Tax=Natronomicrosphaera hydrolytica TaxID=3242702 RepID=A0ABV4U742_9BACT
MPQSRGRRILLAVASGTLLVLACLLVARVMLTPTMPAPDSADANDVVAFMASDQFTQLSSQQRERYVRDLSNRYLRMTKEQRAEFDEQWLSVRGSTALRRQVEAQMAVTVLRSVSTRYFDLPEADRGPFLDRVIMMLEFSDSPMQREFHRWVDNQPIQQSINRGRDHMAGEMQRFRQDLLATTNAEERSQFYDFAGDLLDRARQRR